MSFSRFTNMKITWVTFGQIEQRAGTITSRIASARYRVIIPARELARLGHEIRIVTVDDNHKLSNASDLLKTDVVIFSKSFSAANEELAIAAKRYGTKVLFDICDNHFENPDHGGHYRRMAGLADAVVVNTPQMAEIVHRFTGRESITVSDPYEGPRGTPRWELGYERLKLLWFGHPVNLDTLTASVTDILEVSQVVPMEMNIVTAPVGNIVSECERFTREHGDALMLRFTPWTLETMWRSLMDTQLVVIPSFVDSATKFVKSPNRIIESLWAGRFVVANPIPSYNHFSTWAWIGEHIKQGIRWALDNPNEIPARITDAQRYIESHFSPSVIAHQWEHALEA